MIWRKLEPWKLLRLQMPSYRNQRFLFLLFFNLSSLSSRFPLSLQPPLHSIQALLQSLQPLNIQSTIKLNRQIKTREANLNLEG